MSIEPSVGDPEISAAKLTNLFQIGRSQAAVNYVPEMWWMLAAQFNVLLLVVMLISGLLAMIRGFMREVLSIAAWGIAAAVTLWAFPRVTPLAQTYFSSDTVAKGISIAVVFLITLLIVVVVI